MTVPIHRENVTAVWMAVCRLPLSFAPKYREKPMPAPVLRPMKNPMSSMEMSALAETAASAVLPSACPTTMESTL